MFIFKDVNIFRYDALSYWIYKGLPIYLYGVIPLAAAVHVVLLLRRTRLHRNTKVYVYTERVHEYTSRGRNKNARGWEVAAAACVVSTENR